LLQMTQFIKCIIYYLSLYMKSGLKNNKIRKSETEKCTRLSPVQTERFRESTYKKLFKFRCFIFSDFK
jgi:hypothetical protein